jgi:hypothetical protein
VVGEYLEAGKDTKLLVITGNFEALDYLYSNDDGRPRRPYDDSNEASRPSRRARSNT